MKNKKYRMVESVSKNSGDIIYIIEKHVKFFYWEWWSRHYLNHVMGCFHYYNKDKCINKLHILNKDFDKIDKEHCYFS